MTDKKDLNKVLRDTKKNMEFDRKHPPLIKTKALIDEGIINPGDLEVSYDRTTKLFVNKDRTVAFQNRMDADHHNKSLGIKTLEPPKPFRNDDPSTYPKNQIGRINTWSALVDDAKRNPNDPNSKEVKRMVQRLFNNPKKRKNLGDDELRLIGRHKSQMKPFNKTIEQKPIPKFPQDYEPYRRTPVKTLEEHLTETKPKTQYGLNDNLVKQQLAIAKNVNYVLGKTPERTERRIINPTKEKGQND